MPEEAERAIAAGLRGRMMAVEVFGVTVLAPSGNGQPSAVWKPGAAFGRCAFLTVMGLCELHATDYKPLECRLALPHDSMWGVVGPQVRAQITAAWGSPAGRRAVARFLALPA